MTQDIRTRMHQALKDRMAERGLQFDLPAGPLTVIMEDDIQHTADFPVCDDPSCICYSCEREKIQEATTPHRRRSRQKATSTNSEQEYQRNVAPINGNRPFRLMR